VNTSISKNIKRLRQQAGMTQEQMAEKLFVTRQTVSLWENGKTQPDIQTLEHIAECFDVDMMTVLYGTAALKSEKEQRKQMLLRWVLWAGLLWLVVVFLVTVVLSFYTDYIARNYRMPPLAWISWGAFWYGLPAVGFINGGSLLWLLRKWPEKPLVLWQRLLCGLLFAVCVALLLWMGSKNVTFWFRRVTGRSCFGTWLLTLLTAAGGWGLLQSIRKE